MKQEPIVFLCYFCLDSYTFLQEYSLKSPKDFHRKMPKHPLITLVQNKLLLSSLAEKYGTPLYIYDKEQLVHNIQRLNSILKKYFKSFHICYAVKANNNPHLLKTLKKAVPTLGADCSSPGEIHIAGQNGFEGNDCIYTGNYESPEDLKCALDFGAHINLDDIQSFHRLQKIGLPNSISFRLNPGFGKGAFAQITTGGEDSKFGVPHYDIVHAYELAKNAGVRQFGIQCMTGSGVLDSNYFPNLMIEMLKTVKKLKDQLNIDMNFISMGGGFGIPYTEDDFPLNFDEVFAGVAKNFHAYFNQRQEKFPALWIEPGKSVVGDSAILLTRVTGKKESYKSYIGMDAGMETLMRPALYGAYHRIYKVGSADAPKNTSVDITGRICENTDRLATNRDFPHVEEGDLLAVMDVGAYGFSMSHQFCTRPRSAEILLDGETASVIRKRETIQDIFRQCYD